MWLPYTLLGFVFAVICVFYLFYAHSIEDGDMIDARSLNGFPSEPVSQVQIPGNTGQPSAELLRSSQISLTLMVITERASLVTGSVAIANNRDERIIAARTAAENVLRFAQVANDLAPGSAVTDILQDLAQALSTYDVEKVRSTSLSLAEIRQQLTNVINASDQTNADLANLNRN